MKIIIKTAMISMIMLSICMFSGSNTVDAAKPKQMNKTVKSDLDSIKIKWKKKNVSYYKIYRAKVYKQDDYSISDDCYLRGKNKYKKIAKISNKKKSYIDKNVKNGESYSYVVRGYRKKKGKDKIVYYSSIISPGTISKKQVGVAGITKPLISNYEMKSDILNDGDNIALNIVNYYEGVNPQKYIIYRKAQGEAKFKKIKPTYIGKKKNWGDSTEYKDGLKVLMYRDYDVKPNVNYEYKVKAYRKVGKKKYYSKYSATLQTYACNRIGKFKVTSLTSSGNNVKDIVIKLDSDKNNAKMQFYKTYLINDDSLDYDDYDWMESCGTYLYQKDKESKRKEYYVGLYQISHDNINWTSTWDDSYILQPGETIYLKYRHINNDGEETGMEYDSKNGIISKLDCLWNQADYFYPCVEWMGNAMDTHLYINFLEDTAYTN